MKTFILLMKDLSSQERLLFQNELHFRSKVASTGVLWCLFLGGFGAHRFYMGDVWLGLLYLFFSWSVIPALISIIELFLMPARVRAYNDMVVEKSFVKIRSLRKMVA